MKILLIILLGYFCNGCASDLSLDVSDIISKSKQIADKNLDVDAMDNKYSSKKDWHIYSKFIENANLQQILQGGNKSLEKTSYKKLHIGSSLGNKFLLISKKDLKADDKYNIVEMLIPVYNTNKKIYETVIWIRDKSWSSGFCIIVKFKIKNNKSRFVSAEFLTPTDIEEVK
jgi:hypothetical protein